MVRIDLPNEATEPEVLREALAGRVPNLPATAVLARIAGADLPNWTGLHCCATWP